MRSSPLASMYAAVDAFVQAVGSFANRQGLEIPPKDGSLGAREIAQIKSCPSDEAFETICSQAWLLIEAAGDYLYAVPRLLEEPAMAVAPFASARGVLEGSSEVLWLLDSHIESYVRVARSLALRYRGLAEEAKFAMAWGNADQSAHAHSRIAHVVEIATARSVEVRKTKQGQTIGVGPLIPVKTELARVYLAAEPEYRLLSAVAHSQGAFLLSSSFRRSERPGFVVKSLDPKMAMYLLYKPMTWFARAAWEYYTYVGWNNRELTALMENAFKAVGLKDKEWFWKNELIRP